MQQTFFITVMTAEQVKETEKVGGYNYSEWCRIVDRFAKYNPTFYHQPKGEGYEYDRFYVRYTIEEGITFFSQLGYHSCIHSGGFTIVRMFEHGNKVEVTPVLVEDSKGNKGRIAKDKHNRAIMARNSKNFDMVYSDMY